MINRRKIMVVLPSDNMGGAEQYLFNIAKYYVEKGYSVDVYFLKKKIFDSWESLAGYPTINFFYTNAESELAGIFQMGKNILKNKSNYLYTFTSHVHLNFFLAILRYLHFFKTGFHIGRESTSIHARFKGLKLWIFNIAYKTFYTRLDLLICQSELMKRVLIEHIPSLKASLKIVVLPNPVDLSLIQQKLQQDISDDLCGLGRYIVSAGRLIELKGYDILIKSFARLNEKDLNLVLLGNGPEEKKLRELAIRLDIESRIYFKGFVENVYPYFKEATMCVVSSRIEGFPNVLLQMMASNNNVVATKCAGGIDAIEGVHLAEPNDETSLFGAMEASLKEFGTNVGYNKFSKELESRDINSFMEQITQILENEKKK